VRFGLLGELRIEDGNAHVALAAPKQRALLAILLLERGQPVSVDRLVALLWPSHPPATATKTVQVYVAQLRKTLGEGVVTTRGRAYAVDLERNELDIDRFEELSRDGRRLLAAGHAEEAAAALGEALGLWRGPPLADFAYEDFAQSEVARLEEERLVALEARIDADLALGRDEGLVPELRDLVDRYPLRERPRAQLMIALYRSGRQAEALEEYQAARRTLLEDLGLEPSRQLQEVERAILEHDESLGGPSAPFGTVAPQGRRKAGMLILAGGVLLAAAAAAVVVLSQSDGGGVSSVIEGSSVAAVDPSSGRVVGVYPVGASPAAISVGGGYVWALSVDDRTLSRIDPREKSVRTIGVGAIPTDLVAGAGGVWVGIGERLRRTTFAGWVATSVARIDERTGVVGVTFDLPRRGQFASNVARHHFVVSGEELWAIAPDASVVRIDPRTQRIVATARHASTPVALAAGGGAVWALTDSGTLTRLRPRTRSSADVTIASSGLTALAVGAGSVWATAPRDGTLWRIDPGPRPIQRTIEVGEGADSVTVGGGFVWVANSLAGTLSRVDPRSNRVDLTIPVGNTPTAVTFGEGAVWTTVAGAANAAPATNTGTGDVVELPDTFCGRLYSGTESPRFLVASDLPLQGGPRFPTVQMSEAILFVLRRRGFRAGPYPLAYQSCDDSTAQTGLFDVVKCRRNMGEYVGNPSVIGVIGPFNSGCAYPQLPVANRAGLAIVSPSNSDVGLTRLPFQGRRRDLDALHPTGTRTYAHIMSPDDAEAAAAAVQLERLGANRVFVLYDRAYGPPHAFYFRRAATRLGEEVVGDLGWDPARPASARLARRVAAARPDAIYLCGLLDNGVAGVLAALRRALPPRTIIAGCSGLLPSRFLFLEAGTAAARGTYVAIAGLVNERLGPAGTAFIHDFAATQAGRPVDVAAVYAAHAAEVLLDAIARSDGTRADVARELFRTEARSRLLGRLSIDANGDPVPAPVTIVQLERRGASDAIGSYDGARVRAVVTPERRLLGPPAG
jgi:DNA-binding SARP family transcriptional activator/ABC-type branched-subunit amino acid transport system substrate-binding protein/DNA-binding beta-propeller fold protein YncE